MCRDQSRYVPSQWETLLHCNDVSYWLGACIRRLFPACFFLFFLLFDRNSYMLEVVTAVRFGTKVTVTLFIPHHYEKYLGWFEASCILGLAKCTHFLKGYMTRVTKYQAADTLLATRKVLLCCIDMLLCTALMINTVHTQYLVVIYL